jgi:hypothetical protein
MNKYAILGMVISNLEVGMVHKVLNSIFRMILLCGS